MKETIRDHQRPSACHPHAIRVQSACNLRAICVQSDAISVPKAFMDVATEPDSRLDEARRKHVPKEAAARAVAVVALIEHPSWRHLMKEEIMMKEAIMMEDAIMMKVAIMMKEAIMMKVAIMMKEAILRSDSMAGSAPDGSYMRYKHVAWR